MKELLLKAFWWSLPFVVGISIGYVIVLGVL